MPLHRAIPPPTKAQQRRQDAMREAGCVVARMLGLGFVPGEVHHLVQNGRTISQDHTILLNPYSHRRVAFGGRTLDDCEDLFGPSLAAGSKIFHERYGSNEALLAFQNRLLQQMSLFTGSAP